MPKLCDCECGGEAPIAKETNKKLGWIKGEPKRFIQGHHRKKSQYISSDDYYINKLNCWIWLKAQDGHGYGAVWNGIKVTKAHRLSYEIKFGTIPEGLDLDHLCRDRLCINPDHLEPVTRKTNLLRGLTITATNAQKTHCPQGHEYTKENTYYRSRDNSRNCRQCHNEQSLKTYYRRKDAKN